MIYNYASGSNSTASIGNITGNFIENYSLSYGGAIYNNNGTIGDIIGNFIGNYAKSSYYTHGGAIYNSGTITSIAGDFISNHASCGGAIYNSGTITSIAGDFIGNHAVDGGAIYNSGTIYLSNTTFENNYVITTNGNAQGGVIYNSGKILGIETDFINQYAKSETGSAYGGAIYNSGTITSLTGDFNGSHVQGGNGAYGGAIYNDNNSTISNINSDFVDNYVVIVSTGTNDSYYAFGGAIYNAGTVNEIAGNFTGNYSISLSSSTAGGAVYNDNNSIIDNISGDFIGNYVVSTSSCASGGAIYNIGTLKNVSGNFTENYAKSETGTAQGGAIFKTDYVQDQLGSNSIFIEKETIINADTNEQFTIHYVCDGKNYNILSVSDIQNMVNKNPILVVSMTDEIELVSNDEYISYFQQIDEYTEYGYYITNPLVNIDFSNSLSSDIQEIYAIPTDNMLFKNNYAQGKAAQGGAIYTRKGNVENLKSKFENNYVVGTETAQGGAVYNKLLENPGNVLLLVEWKYSIINEETDETKTVYLYQSTDDESIQEIQILLDKGLKLYICQEESSQTVSADNWDNYVLEFEEYINMGEASEKSVKDFIDDAIVINDMNYIYLHPGKDAKLNTLNIINSTFTKNYAKSETGIAQGGAIYSEGDLNIIADGEDVVFSENYAQGKTAQGGVIYVENKLNSLAKDGNIVFNGNYVKSESEIAQGGAIYNKGNIEKITANFTENYAQSTNGIAQGGAIYNAGKESIIRITDSVFEDNYVECEGTAQGGAIYNE